MTRPSPRGDPPSAPCVIAGCSHEVYRGEDLFTDPRGRTLCPDCLGDIVAALDLRVKAALLGMTWGTVRGGPGHG